MDVRKSHNLCNFHICTMGQCQFHNNQRVTRWMKTQWLLYVPPGLTYINSICRHSALVCFVRFPQQTRPLTVEARFRSKVSPCEICGGQSDTGTGFSPNTSVFPCQYHSISAPYSSYMLLLPEGTRQAMYV